MKLLKRILQIVEGIIFILLSLCWQSLFCAIITMAIVLGTAALGWNSDNVLLKWVIFIGLLALFNGVACYDYFLKHRAQVQLGKKSSIIFMFPRAIDLIWNGSERISR